MTPSVPLGSDAGSSIPPSDPTPARTVAPRAPELPAVAPLRVSLGSSYLAVGSAGFPLRANFSFAYRPMPYLGVGLHADTNFTDHFSGTLRLEGIWPIHRFFHLEVAGELGARALIQQNQVIDGIMQPLSGAAFTFGAEIAASVPFSDLFGLSVFARGFYSPGGGLNGAPSENGEPSRGIAWSAGEFSIGLRVDIYPPVAPRLPAVIEETERPRPEPAPVAATETAPAPRDALQTFQATVDRLLRDTAVAPSTPSTTDAGTVPTPVTGDAGPVDPATPSAATSTETREEILALQREILALTASVSSLETEIQGATQLLNDLSLGQETGEPFHVRLDGFYDQLTARPPQVDVAALNTFLHEFRDILRDSDPLRLLIQSSTETFGGVILRNLRAFDTELRRHQRTLPARASGTRMARGDLDEPLAQIGALIQQLEQMRQHPETTTPPASQVSLWRVRMERIRTHLNTLDDRLSDDTYGTLNTQFTQLENGYNGLLASMEEARRNWMASRALFSHYQSLRSATRPAQAEAALRGMMTELSGAPASFRRLRERNLNSLRVAVEAFFQNHRTQATWANSRDLAVSVLRWIDPSYATPPPPAARSRRGSSPAATATPVPGGTTALRFPPSGGGTSRRGE